MSDSQEYTGPERRRDASWRTEELMARLDERMTQVQRDLLELRRDVVTRAEFNPVRLVVYGLVSMVMTGFGGGLLYLLLHGK